MYKASQRHQKSAKGNCLLTTSCLNHTQGDGHIALSKTLPRRALEMPLKTMRENAKKRFHLHTFGCLCLFRAVSYGPRALAY